jgi:hypothetical protein
LAAFATALALVGTGLVGSPSAHAAGPTVRCTEDNDTITEDEVTKRQTIVVAAGVECTIQGVTAKAIRSRGAASVEVIDSTILRNIMIAGTIGNVTVGNAGCRIDPTVGNNLKIRNTGGNVAVCQVHTKNNISVRRTAGAVGVFENCAGNNLTVAGTSGVARVRENGFENNLHLRANADLRERNNSQVDRGTCKPR